MFLSRRTLFTGLLNVLIWSLEWNWTAGISFTLLLYLHEAGHLLFARLRGMRVAQAPIFVPGLGAYVEVEATARPWDGELMALGGPLAGAVAAWLCIRAGIAWSVMPLAFAGHFALVLNLLNLAPVSPLDGGRMLLKTGWLKVVAMAGGALSLLWVRRPEFLVIYLAAALGGLVDRRRSPACRAPHAPAIASVYMLAVAGIAWLAARMDLHLAVAPIRPAWMPRPSLLILFVILPGVWAADLAWHRARGAAGRYLTAAVLGWPRYLVQEPLCIPVMLCLGAGSIGLPGLLWLEWLIGKLLRTEKRGIAAEAAGWGADLLVRQGRNEAAEAWLARLERQIMQEGQRSG